MQDDFAIVIMTVSRAGQYVHDTLASLGPDSPVRLVVGSPDTDYLAQYRAAPWIEIVAPSEAEWEPVRASPVHQRASWNLWRCLTQDCLGDLVTFEDDVRFAKGWRARLRRTVRALEEGHGQDFALALYGSHWFIQDGYDRGLLYVDYPLHRFFGTQGMFWTARTRRGFADYLKKNGVDHYRIPYDLLLAEYLAACGTPLYATAPSLVQHTGPVTTGLAGVSHQADSFQWEVE